MRLVVQRVRNASCEVNEKLISSIKNGLLVYVGFKDTDTFEMIDKYADKLVNLRIMSDSYGTLNYSIMDISCDIMLIPNFTLYGDAKHGRRPSFSMAGNKADSLKKYEYMITKLQSYNLKVGFGEYGADMKILSIADGPVNIIIEEE